MPWKGKENIPPTKSCGCLETAKRPNLLNYYKYYDTPDGCDVFKKVLVTSRYGAMAGLLLSTYDVLMYSHAIGFGPIMRRYAYHTIPLTLMGATFAGVTNTVLRMREEDDLLNYFIGGFACGPILRFYLGTNHAVLLGGLALGIIAMIKKDSVDSGYELFPHLPTHMRSVRKWRADYTYVPDPKDKLIHTCGVDK
ncbi:NADH dehydrogenase [ubiquinone] 1 alpha subcomplex subunit 11-like [Maniola hyperantus]|uniref:NADH dehydrogenase [ubiquinone] 1 alpha subcomplex subunit 11-like n=1 Tax=Aphantopus hyperantus TaxID=2795564 RepID=UPI001567D00D|nr:NADH dehydrogenase [ubiquinone] 1 alpha subcomplex subunit 11-like [Maniola hyperantus]